MIPDESPDPAPAARRRFTLVDGMALVAAFGLCCAVPRLFNEATVGDAISRILLMHPFWVNVATFWATVFSATLALLEGFGPRPAGGRRFRGPGGLAMLMVLASWAYASGQAFVTETILFRIIVSPASRMSYDWAFRPMVDASPQNGLAVLAAWATLIRVGAWEPSGDWLDRSGRTLGGLWVVSGLLNGFFYFVWPAR